MPDPVRYVYDAVAKRYRYADSGRAVPASRLVKLRDAFVETQRHWSRDLAGMLARRELSLSRWEQEVRNRVKTAHVAEYVLGVGGRNAMRPSDWGRIGSTVKRAYGFLRNFAAEIAGGTMSEGQIGARTDLYLANAREGFERGRASRYDGLAPPAYPGDGTCAGGGRCRCTLKIEETATEYRVYWIARGDARSCAQCRSRAAEWSPWVQAKEAA